MANENVALPKLKIAPALRARFEAGNMRIDRSAQGVADVVNQVLENLGMVPGEGITRDKGDYGAFQVGEFSLGEVAGSVESVRTEFGTAGVVGGVRKSRPRTQPLIPQKFDTIVSFNLLPDHPELGIDGSKKEFRSYLAESFPEVTVGESDESDFYLRIVATAVEIDQISTHKSVKMIWPNNAVSGHLVTSVETVRASACWRTFEARGDGITWAVLDTGINEKHPHFVTHATVDPNLSKSFVAGNALSDPDGHGTHVAGIIAGSVPPSDPANPYRVSTLLGDNFTPVSVPLDKPPSGLAPLAKLISVQVLTSATQGNTFDCIRGLEYIRKLNQNSSELQVDGANLSFGYDLEAATYGCGNSPICEEVDRCVNAGICVVVSCGNSGFGVVKAQAAGVVTSAPAGIAISISDPANAELSIAVGSVHKSEPHRFGISYFSSKGPTLDGRQKPDMVAPGEKVYSCCADLSKDPYCEMSGTSMAAAHVSGAIAAFLSVRHDFRGNPREVKKIFLDACLDLKRDSTYQGAGMVDAFKALISV